MNEIEWLAERRPKTGEPDAAATTSARAALLEHARRPRAAAPRPAAVSRRFVHVRRRVVAGASLVAVAAIVAAALLPGGDHAPQIAPPAAKAAPLVLLAKHLQHVPAPPGDATLVLRKHVFPNAPSFTGADLYLDSGRYFYGATLDELRAGAAANPDENTGDNDTTKAERRAAVDALNVPDKAREEMIAIFTPAPGTSANPPAAARKQLEAKKRAESHATASPRSIANNRVWIGCMDALIAGAGRADVRAGVMKLLAMMPEVKVEPGDGVLRLRMTDFPDGYEETLVVDDATGVIREMVGGTHGERPSVVVTYDVRRVTAADVLDH